MAIRPPLPRLLPTRKHLLERSQLPSPPVLGDDFSPMALARLDRIRQPGSAGSEARPFASKRFARRLVQSSVPAFLLVKVPFPSAFFHLRFDLHKIPQLNNHCPATISFQAGRIKVIS